jgi:hypothetical protein
VLTGQLYTGGIRIPIPVVFLERETGTGVMQQRHALIFLKYFKASCNHILMVHAEFLLKPTLFGDSRANS